MTQFKPNQNVRLPIMWNRLIALVEEQAQVMIRTAFSPMVRSCGDLSVGAFDLAGRMLAQAVTGTPGHVNTMAESVRHFLRHFPVDSMSPGDAYITNDPWMGTGHLNDFVVLTPCFRGDHCVALFCSTSHQMDVGGMGASTDAPDVFTEGLQIPMMKLLDRGKVNQTLIAMIEANSRLPIDTVGDTYSLIACNDVGVTRLLETLDDFGVSDIADLADHIVDRSREAVIAEIAALPHGTWYNELTLDGYDAPLTLRAALTISETGVHVDLSGSSAAVRQGINVPLNYAAAYAAFGIRCVIGSAIPNNSGSLMPVTIVAPEGSILNAVKPMPVGARHVVGQMLPDLVFGCLAQVVPERVPAEGASSMWAIAVRGQREGEDGVAHPYALALTTSGGMGARFTRDGLAATAFPSGIHCMPVEVAETQVPLIFWRKELRVDSGGAGRSRGGLGQIIEIESLDGRDFLLRAAFERIENPARGRSGGQSGAPGYVGLASGERLRGKGVQTIPAGKRLVVHTPGGGGLGDVSERNIDAITADLREGRITPKCAQHIYGFTIPSER